MKKLLSLLLVLTMTIGIAPLSGFVGLKLPEWLNLKNVFNIETEAAETSGIFTYEIVDGEVTITGCDSYASGAITVPSYIAGYPVTTIGERAFYSCSEINKIILPDTLIVVEEDGLPEGYDLVDIDLGNSVTKIVGFDLFSSNENINVVLPDSLIAFDRVSVTCNNIYIGKNFRYYNPYNDSTIRAASITVDKDNPYYVSIDGVLFSKDGKTLVQYPSGSTATTYTVPATVEKIGSNAFSNAKNLVRVNIPDNVKIIGKRAFGNCQNLSEINIGNGIEYIEEIAFYNTLIYNNAGNWVNGILYVDDCAITYNDSLPKNASFKNGTRLIAEAGFESAPFETVNIPDTVNYICERAFYDSSLKTVKIPGSVENLSYRAFGGCDNLTSVTIGDGVKKLLGESINSKNLKSIELGSGIEFISETAMYTTAYVNNKNNYNGNELIIDNYIIDAEYSTVGTYYIGKNIRGIAEGAFRSCSQVTAFSVDKNNQFYSTDEYGVLFNKDKTILVAFPDDCGITEYTVPSTVKKIGEYAFSNNYSSLTKLNLPEGLVEIGEYAFFSNYTIEQVDFPSSLKRIEKYAFGYCFALKNVELTEGIAFIGDYAFAYCSSFKVITIPDSVTELGRSVFLDCSCLENVTIGNGINTFPIQCFYDCTSLKTITMNNSIDYVFDSAFWNMLALTDIYYIGTKEQWRAIIVEDQYFNAPFYNATIHFSTLDHTHSYKSETIAPTCTEQGYTLHKCSGCDDFYTDDFIASLGHSWGSWVTVNEATENSDGLKKRVCSVCKSEETEVLKYQKFDTSILRISNSTINRDGNTLIITATEGADQINLYPTTTEGKIVDIKIEGTPIKVSGSGTYYLKFSDWHKAGNKVETTITIDGIFIFDIIFIFIVENEGHNYQLSRVEPTCTENGSITYTCTVCGNFYVEEIPAKGHNHVTVVVDPTCEYDGYTHHTCTDCNYDVKDSYVPATGHDDTDLIETKEATCTENGYKKYYCAECKDYYFVVIVFLGHTEGEWIVVTEPTYWNTGRRVKYCLGCGNIIYDEIIPMLVRDRIEININDVSMNYKQTVNLNAEFVSDRAFYAEYSSSNLNVATIDENGNIYASGTGEAVITVTVYDDYGNVYEEICKVTVTYAWWQWIIIIVLFGWIWY